MIRPHAVILEAIDVTIFTPDTKKPVKSVRSQSRPYRILSVGRLVWKKGFEYTLQAVKCLVEQGISCEYHIVGDGDLKDAIAFTCRDLGLEHVVKLLGPKSWSEVKIQFEWGDVFLLGSVTEGFSNAALEAQAMSVPVVCTDAEGLAENISNEETGFIVPRRDWHSMADKLALLARDPKLRIRMGEAGRQQIMEKFLVPDQLENFDRFYRHVLAKSQSY